jgi:tetratricopeptide (TPR) repeat protein
VAFCEECLAVSREAGDLWFIGQALSNLGLAYYQQGKYGIARKHFTEALEIRRALRDQTGIAWSLVNLGDVEQAQGNLQAARSRLEESLALLRDLGDRSGRADALASLGRVAQVERDYAGARARYVESLLLRYDLGHRLAMPEIFEYLAGLAAAQRMHGHSTRLLGVASALRESFGAPRSSTGQMEVDAWLRQAIVALGEAIVQQDLRDGRAMSVSEAVAYAIGEDDALA